MQLISFLNVIIITANIYCDLLSSRHYSEDFTSILLFNAYNSPSGLYYFYSHFIDKIIEAQRIK